MRQVLAAMIVLFSATALMAQPPAGKRPDEDWRAMPPPPAGLDLPIPGMRARRGEPEGMSDVRTIAHRLVAFRMEAEELKRREEVLAEEEERTERRLEGGEIDNERAERLRKIFALQRELLPLERAEFTADAQEKSAIALERVRAAREQAGSKAHPGLERMEQRIEALHDSATDFDTLYAEISQMPPPREDSFGMPEDTRSREIEALRERLDRLEEELGTNVRPRERRRPIDGMDQPGALDAPPPPVEMKERKEREKERRAEP